MVNILVRGYKEKGSQTIPLVRLTDEEYARGIQCFVPTCVDIVPIDRRKKIIYLAKRKTKPMKGWWWIGGKINPDDSVGTALVKNLKRETGLSVPAGRFKLIAFLDHRWKDREQSPQDIGCHMTALTFTIELSSEEITRISEGLDETFEKGTKFIPFTREEIEEEIKKGVPIVAILDVYNHIFS